jgi:ribosomal protein S18 acetylase RimI-like enzyme
VAENQARRLGFTHEEVLPGMTLRELVEPPETGLAIARADSAEELAAARAVYEAGFELPAEMLAPFFVPEFATATGFVVYLGRRNGEPVTTATSWIADGAVGIFNVGTPPEHRGHGYAAEVTAHAVREGLASGAELAWLQASPRARQLYERLGFETVERYLLLGRPPA